jgi:hypothetical protein
VVESFIGGDGIGIVDYGYSIDVRKLCISLDSSDECVLFLLV